jgi:hypothetical protein
MAALRPRAEPRHDSKDADVDMEEDDSGWPSPLRRSSLVARAHDSCVSQPMKCNLNSFTTTSRRGLSCNLLFNPCSGSRILCLQFEELTATPQSRQVGETGCEERKLKRREARSGSDARIGSRPHQHCILCFCVLILVLVLLCGLCGGLCCGVGSKRAGPQGIGVGAAVRTGSSGTAPPALGPG